MRLILLAFLLVAACGRTLTPTEQTFMSELMGPTLNIAPIRMADAGFIGIDTRTYPARPQTTCRERINPPPDGPTIRTRTAGVVLWQQVLTSPDWTVPDYARGYPDRINLPAAMFFAHEMTHIWQWQNRGVTGYSPLRAAAEHRPGVDPYLFDPQDEITFLEMGYEQQAVLVEEFVCCRTLDPTGARTGRLYDVLRAAMPVQHPRQTPRPGEVLGVWEGTEIAGICG